MIFIKWYNNFGKNSKNEKKIKAIEIHKYLNKIKFKQILI